MIEKKINNNNNNNNKVVSEAQASMQLARIARFNSKTETRSGKQHGFSLIFLPDQYQYYIALLGKELVSSSMSLSIYKTTLMNNGQ